MRINEWGGMKGMGRKMMDTGSSVKIQCLSWNPPRGSFGMIGCIPSGFYSRRVTP